MVNAMVLGIVVTGGAVSLDAKVMDLGRASGGSPYERYMGPVKEVLRQTARRDSEFERVSALLAEARSFRYRHSEAYVANSPEVTERTRIGDCKDKSLWLLAKMGSGNARFVIGKLKSSSDINHAWVYWQAQDGAWYILDPTHRSRPLAVDRIRSNEYVPLYSYASNTVYHHDADRPVAANRRPVEVADARDYRTAQRGSVRVVKTQTAETKQTTAKTQTTREARDGSDRGFADRLSRLDRSRGLL